MKTYNKAILVILVVLTTMAISGCGSVARYQNSIFNDDKKIVKAVDSYTYRAKVGDATESKIDMKFTSFTGMDTIYRITADKESKVIFNFESVVEKGDFKVVLIMPDDEVINIVSGTKEGSETILLKEGTSRIKFVGRKTKGHIKVSLGAGEDVKIKKNN